MTNSNEVWLPSNQSVCVVTVGQIYFLLKESVTVEIFEVIMPHIELLSERMAQASLQRRRHNESERRERIFNHKLRTIGIDKQTLDLQVRERKQQEEAEKQERDAYDAEILHNTKVAQLLHNRQVKERQEINKDIVNYRQQYQQLQKGGENDPDCMKTGEAQMTLPGLVGEDPESESRQQRQKEQLRGWLIQQQRERALEQQQHKLEEQHYDQSRVGMDNKAMQLENAVTEKRRAVAVETNEFNLTKIKEKEHCQEAKDNRDSVMKLQQLMSEEVPGAIGVPGLCPSSDRRAPPESLQQVVQFQKYQIEEKKWIRQQNRREEEQIDRVRLDSARSALLIERQKARLNKQLRQHQDSTNLHRAETHKQLTPDIKRGGIDDSFFSQFNTCSR